MKAQNLVFLLVGGVVSYLFWKQISRSDSLDPNSTAPLMKAPGQPLTMPTVGKNTPTTAATYPYVQPQAPRADYGNSADQPWYVGAAAAASAAKDLWGLGSDITSWIDDAGWFSSGDDDVALADFDFEDDFGGYSDGAFTDDVDLFEDYDDEWAYA